mgnify:CR=1 FL=1
MLSSELSRSQHGALQALLGKARCQLTHIRLCVRNLLVAAHVHIIRHKPCELRRVDARLLQVAFRYQQLYVFLDLRTKLTKFPRFCLTAFCLRFALCG